MVLIFTAHNTEVIKGILSNSKGLVISEGEIAENNKIALQNSLKVLLIQQGSQGIQFIHSTLEENLNILILCRKTVEPSLEFSIIQNPIFRSNQAYDYLVQQLQNSYSDNEDELLDDPMKFLCEAEMSLVELPATDYLQYMPLLLNYLLENIYREFREKKEVSLKQSLENQPKSIYSDILEMFFEEFANDNSRFKNHVDDLIFYDDSNTKQESIRFYYNLLILAMKLGKPPTFERLFSYNLNDRIDYHEDVFNDYICLIAANWYLVSDVKKSYGYISRVGEKINQFLSVKSQINYLRLKGAIYEKTGQYSKSMDSYLASVSYLDNLENLTPSAGLAYAGIGNIHSIIGQHMKAITAYSFAASLFNYLSLKNQEQSMLNNILTIRTLKAKSYISAGLVSLNNERYKEADEYIERAVQEFALLLIETPQTKIVDSVQEIISVLNPLVLRKEVDKNLELMITQSLEDLTELLNICHTIKDGKVTNINEFDEIGALATPRKLRVFQVVLIHHDGRYITSLSSEDELVEKDKNMIFAGAMTAIQLLLKEVIHSEKIHTIDAGENQILLRKANLIQVVIIANKISEEIITAADTLIDSIEEKYGEILEDWDGSLKELKNTSSLMKEFIYDQINE